MGKIEARKMESRIRAPVAGLAERVAGSSGTNVERGSLLVALKGE
jgi:biotin carboxyl carrier protein